MMTTVTLAIVLATPLTFRPPEPPAIAELERFPSLAASNARIRLLTKQRNQIRLAPDSPENDAALHINTYRLECWMLLREAHGGGGLRGWRDAEAVRRLALADLAEWLGEADWRAGRMP